MARLALMASVLLSMVLAPYGWSDTVSVHRVLVTTGCTDTFGRQLTDISPWVSVNDNKLVGFLGKTVGPDGRIRQNLYSVAIPYSSEDAVSPPMPMLAPSRELPETGDRPWQELSPPVLTNDGRAITRRRIDPTLLVTYLVAGLPQTQVQYPPMTYIEEYDATRTSTRSLRLVQGADPGVWSLVTAPGHMYSQFSDALWMGYWGYLPPGLPSWAPTFEQGSPSPYYPYDNRPGAAGTGRIWIAFQGASARNESFPWISNEGQVVFTGLGSDYVNCLSAPGLPRGSSLATTVTLARPRVANGKVVFLYDSGSTRQLCWAPCNSPQAYSVIAGPSNGFTTVGQSPGISDDASIVVFYANLSDEALAAQMGTTTGPGVFAYSEQTQSYVRLAAVDPTGILGFDADARVCVNNRGYCVFQATTSAGKAIFTVRVQKGAGAGSGMTSTEPMEVIRKGSWIAGNQIDDLAVFDSINDNGGSGDIVYWCTFTDGRSAVAASRYATLDVVDYNDEAFQEGVHGNEWLASLFTKGEPRAGFAADGVTPLLIRTPPFSGPGTARLTVRDENDSQSVDTVGELSDPMTGNHGNTLDVNLVKDPNSDDYRAFAVLTSPIDFVRGPADEARGHATADKRKITVSAQLLDGSATAGDSLTREIIVDRPPVLYIHGLEDFPDCFQWSVTSDPRFLSVFADYRTTHSAWLMTNRETPRRWVELALARMRASGIAATQVDVFGHSMGGLVSRLYSMNVINYRDRRLTGYRRPENFGKGDFHKLITVDTPHRGSQASDLLVYPSDEYDIQLTPLGVEIEYYMGLLGWNKHDNDQFEHGRSIREGANVDMHTQSPFLADMNAVNVEIPVHAIVGNGGPNDIPWSYFNGKRWDDFWYVVRTWMGARFYGHSISEIFGGPNDLVVSQFSQEGGLSGAKVTYVGGDEGWHYQIAHDYPAGNANAAADMLLNASVKSDRFDPHGFPTYMGVPPGLPDYDFSQVAVDVVEAYLSLSKILTLGSSGGTTGRITESEATVLKPGEQITLSIDLTRAPADFQAVVGASWGDTAVVTHENPSATLTVPTSACGSYVLGLVGSSGTSTMLLSRQIEVTVIPEAVVTELMVEPHSVQLVNYAPAMLLSVKGLYSDAVIRDVTDPSTGTTYAVQDTEIVEVDANGGLRARKVGVTRLTVSNGTASASVGITVESVKGDWNRNSRIDCIDAQEFWKSYSGPNGGHGFVFPSIEHLDCFDMDDDDDIDDDDWAFLRGMLPSQAISTTIHDAEAGDDGSFVEIDGAVVSAAFTGFFYIESDDRSCGIRVDKTSHAISVGMRVMVRGLVATNSDGERCIDAGYVLHAGDGNAVPIGMINRTMGGGAQFGDQAGDGQGGITDAVGANNIGLLVTTWGKVTHTEAGCFYVDDGSGVADDSGYIGIRVVADGLTLPSEDSTVRVTGISSCFASNGSVHRLLRARSQSDIIVQ